MVHIYISNVQNLPDPKDSPKALNVLSEERKKKTLRFLQAKDRKQSLGAGLLLNYVLRKYYMDEKKIVYGTHGKPEIQGLFFNLSHSHDYVVCAVSDKAVGCDIEKTSKIRENIAEHFFTQNEVDYLNHFDGEERMDEFYRIWTMKESYMKMTGEGMSLPLNSFEFVISDTIKVYRDGEACSCFIKEYEVPGYKLTVCSEEELFPEYAEYIDLHNMV